MKTSGGTEGRKTVQPSGSPKSGGSSLSFGCRRWHSECLKKGSVGLIPDLACAWVNPQSNPDKGKKGADETNFRASWLGVRAKGEPLRGVC